MKAYKEKQGRASKAHRPMTPTSIDGPTSPWAFTDNFHATGQGLIYGRGDKRVHYRRELESIPFADTSLAIDPYNNTISDKVVRSYGDNPDLIIRFNYADSEGEQEILKKMAVPDNLKAMVRKQRPDLNWRPYFDVGRDNPKFNMAAIYREAAEKYGQGSYFQFTPEGTPHLLWKRGSKLGIEMAARKSARIHFVLDGVDMHAVTQKAGVAGDAITSSELRYAYRNRNRLAGNLYFYRNKKRVRAPWDAEPDLWANSATRHTQKARPVEDRKTKLLRWSKRKWNDFKDWYLQLFV